MFNLPYNLSQGKIIPPRLHLHSYPGKEADTKTGPLSGQGRPTSNQGARLSIVNACILLIRSLQTIATPFICPLMTESVVVGLFPEGIVRFKLKETA